MSSGLQNKMYTYEVPPPSGIWEQIAAELDESELSQKFPSGLRNIEMAPPAFVWQKIAAVLDEPQLINDYSSKLTGIEVTPPADIWNKIATALNEKQVPVVRKQKRFFSFIKYAAAAAIMGFLTWGGIQLFNNKTSDTSVAKQEPSLLKESTVTAASVEGSANMHENLAVTDVEAAIEEARNDAALEASKKTFAKLDFATTRSKIKNAADFFFVADDYEPTGTRGFTMDPQDYLPEPPPVDIANRYIMLITPDGKIIRMSKKFGDLVCCVSGEEQDKDCIDQMQKWREKIANPSKTHSPGNFMDIISLLKSLQEN